VRVQAAVFVLLFLLGICGESYGQTESIGFRNWFLISDPSNERPDKLTRNDVRRGWICADAASGSLQICPTDFEIFESPLPISVPGVVDDCNLDANLRVVPGTCANGGHRHVDATGAIVGDDRPVLFRVLDRNITPDPPFEDVRYPGDMDNEPRTVTGVFTGFGILTPDNAYTWTVPHVGGVYRFQSSLRPSDSPSNRKFVEFFGGFLFLRDRLVARGELNVTFRRDTLRQLPAIPSIYVKRRNGGLLHDDSLSYAAQEKTIQAAGAIAYLHKMQDGRLLSFNDISLPKGGMFDWSVASFPWRRTHQSHREGLDIDINKPIDPTTGLGERCDHNTAVQTAVNMILTGIPRKDGSNTALLCENRANGFRGDTGNYHLDVTTFNVSPAVAAALKVLQQAP